MAYVLRDEQNLFVGCFDETSKDQFQFIATDLSEYYSENLSLQEFRDRSEDENESIQLDIRQMVKILKEEKPESCSINKEDDRLRVDLKFAVKLKEKVRVVKFFMKVVKCSANEVPKLFLIALMKLAIENSVMVSKMREALEAKDKEIEAYKMNGATLIRETLATKPFDFDEVKVEISLPANSFKLTASFLAGSNIPALCEMIKGDNILEATKPVEVLQPAAQDQLTQPRKRNKSQRVVTAPLKKKEFKYDDEDMEVEKDVPEPKSQGTTSKKAKKTVVL